MKDEIKKIITKHRSSVPFWELSTIEQEDISDLAKRIADNIVIDEKKVKEILDEYDVRDNYDDSCQTEVTQNIAKAKPFKIIKEK